MTKAEKAAALELLTSYERDAITNDTPYYRGAVIGAICMLMKLKIPHDDIERALEIAHYD